MGKSGKSDCDQQQEQQQATVDSASDSESEDETQTTGKFKFYQRLFFKPFIESGPNSFWPVVGYVLKLVEIGWETWTGLGNDENFLSGRL